MSVNKSTISLSETGYFSPLIIDYLNHDVKLKPFYTYDPTISSFPKAIENKNKEHINRELLVKVLKEQNQYIQEEPSTRNSSVYSNIESLLHPNTFTVTTGHQLCLFTGPLYFIYKIITTINLSEELNKKYPACHFVPVYWMASEDHDFEEINNINLFGKKIVWEQPQKGAVGKINTASLSALLEDLKSVLGDSYNAGKLYNLLTQAYLGHTNLAEATRFLVNGLFGNYGLIVIDGDDKRLKKEFVGQIKDDILNNTNYKCVNLTIKELEKHHIKPQVNPREINCFYMMEGIRERIEKDSSIPGLYRVLNTSITFNEEELLAEIEAHPERFSPNVVLRSLYQEKILPNIAYIGGGGELSYWLEYRKMLEHQNINFPVLLLRNSMLWVDKNSSEKLNKLSIDKADIFLETDELIRKFITENAGIELSLKEEEEKLKTLFREIIKKAENIDVTLIGSVEAELQKQLKALKNIEHKLLKAEKNNQETSVNQIKKIKEKLFPGNGLQERYDNFIPWFLKYGDDFIARLKTQLQPFEAGMLILEEV